MAKIITFGIQKGGAAKTTTAGITAFILSKTHKVLAIDLDSQGNLTELITMTDIYDFHGSTILEALKNQNTDGFIQKITDNLHIITADDHLATFSKWLYSSEYKGNKSLALAQTLASVVDKYDYIILDTPPALSDITINALAVSDGVVAMLETSKFCYSALGRFIETIEQARNIVNPKLKLLGILCTLIDVRRVDNKAIIELVQEEYEGQCFNTIIQRKAATGRLAINGLFDNSEINLAIGQHKAFVEEMLNRV